MFAKIVKGVLFYKTSSGLEAIFLILPMLSMHEFASSVGNVISNDLFIKMTSWRV